MLKLLALFGLVVATMAAPQQLTLHGIPQFHQQPQRFHIQPVQQQQQVQQVHSVQASAGGASPQTLPATLIPAVNPVNFVSAASPDGSSLHGFQTLDGQSHQETIGADGSRRGSYSYTDASGQQVVVHYIADQHGFRSSNDPVSIALGSTAPRPTTTSTQAPVTSHHRSAFGGLVPAGTSLSHFGFQPLVQQQQAQQQPQFTLTGR